MREKEGRSPYWHIRTALFIFLGLVLVGTAGYVLFARLSVFDALYQTCSPGSVFSTPCTRPS